MSDQTARERMTREQLKLQRFTAYDDTEKEEREVVPLVDALAYGADERAAGVAEGLMIATKAMCGFCSNQYGRADDDQPVVPVKDKFGTWVHGDGKGWTCSAGPIHDAIQAMRCTNPAFGCDPEANEHDETCVVQAGQGETDATT